MTEQEFVDKYLLDWKNVVDEKGKVIPFDRDNAIVMFKEHPGLFNALMEALEVA